MTSDKKIKKGDRVRFRSGPRTEEGVVVRAPYQYTPKRGTPQHYVDVRITNTSTPFGAMVGIVDVDMIIRD